MGVPLWMHAMLAFQQVSAAISFLSAHAVLSVTYPSSVGLSFRAKYCM